MTNVEVLTLEALRRHHQLTPIELARALWPTSLVWPEEKGMAGAAGNVLRRMEKAGLVENPQQLAMMKGVPRLRFWSLTLAGVEWLAMWRAVKK